MKNSKNKGFAKKSLGQNFLKTPEIRQKILETAGDIQGKEILEIGPGLGFLTTKLLNAGTHLTAVEFDPRAAEILMRDFSHMSDFQLIQGDILDQDLDSIFDQKKYSIIANIPYNITAPILKKICSQTKNRPEFAVLMVQKEVAEKITDTEKRSILSISVEIFAESEYCFTVGRENFSPAPRVDSAVIKLTTRPTPLVPAEMEADFFTVVNAGFAEKRKKLGNHIGKFFGFPAEKLLGNIDPNLRAERLTIKDWLTITRNFGKLKKNSHSRTESSSA